MRVQGSSPLRYNAPPLTPPHDSAEPEDRLVGAPIRRAISVLDRMIGERDLRIAQARRDRVTARRLCWAMSVATVVSSVAVLCGTLLGAGPLAAALWVVPSALGGSAVSQAAAALGAAERIRTLEVERTALAAARGTLLSELHNVRSRCIVTPPGASESCRRSRLLRVRAPTHWVRAS